MTEDLFVRLFVFSKMILLWWYWNAIRTPPWLSSLISSSTNSDLKAYASVSRWRIRSRGHVCVSPCAAGVYIARAVFSFFPLPVFFHMCCRLTGGCVAMCLFLSTQRNLNICPHVHCVIDDQLNGLNSDFAVSRGCTAAFRSVAKWLKQGHDVNLLMCTLHRWRLVFFCFF